MGTRDRIIQASTDVGVVAAGAIVFSSTAHGVVCARGVIISTRDNRLLTATGVVRPEDRRVLSACGIIVSGCDRVGAAGLIAHTIFHESGLTISTDPERLRTAAADGGEDVPSENSIAVIERSIRASIGRWKQVANVRAERGSLDTCGVRTAAG